MPGRMATTEIPNCRGCDVPVPTSSSGRRHLDGPSNIQVTSTWKSLLREKFEVLKLFVEEDEVFLTGFMRKKCFWSFESFDDTKNKLLECIHEAIKYISTSPRPTDDNDAAQSVSLLGKQQTDPCVDTGLSVKRKRSCIQYNLPSTTSSSPDVQVRKF